MYGGSKKSGVFTPLRSPPTSASVLRRVSASPGFKNEGYTCPSDNCYQTFRSFLRVRPFIGNEVNQLPVEQIVQRPIIEFNPNNKVVSVLDPSAKFRPKNGGIFENMSNMLWSFEEADPSITPQAPRQLQADVYAKTISPLKASIQEGYGTGVVIYGAADSGKHHTLYGSEWEGADRGIFPRFAEDIFSILAEQKRENATITVEVEVFEIVNEVYVDLLSSKRMKEELKVRDDPQEGIIIQGITRIVVPSSQALISTVRKVIKSKKRKNTHIINLRITETYLFKDTDSKCPETTKNRRINVFFALVEPVMPPSYTRCYDLAIERDIGENTQAKPPVRDCAFTRICSDMFYQNINVTLIGCVSPFFKDVKETFNTVSFCNRVKYIRTNPKLNHDNSTLELRKLADEMKDLTQCVEKTNEAQQIVQDELDKRQIELERQERINEELKIELAEERSIQGRIKDTLQMEVDRLRRENNERKREVNIIISKIEKLRAQTRSMVIESEELKKEKMAALKRISNMELEINHQSDLNEPFDSQIQMYRQEEARVKEMEDFINAGPEGRLLQIAALVKVSDTLKRENMTLSDEVEMMKNETAGINRKKALTEFQYNLIKEKELAQIEKEIKELEAEIKKMDAKMGNSGGCCAGGCSVQ
eukprot:Tbor_TRINITY_DN6644_c0_g1::TRINITY_DN6644_c0_g1_i1::g.3094::m.3094